ncbi:MAG: putative PHD type zinc finger protein with BAH domain-containing protein [Thelocarpon superellum]|nr:MAG: putative PHD type zinc finger protein with BAH domain-containing protein [Thelocarpon superellum]
MAEVTDMSTAEPSHAPSPVVHVASSGPEHGPGPDIPSSHPSSPSLLRPDDPHSDARPQPTTSSAIPNGRAEPMRATSSASSNASQRDGSVGASNGASPYGTRSRNRTGGVRPNYAEDREMEVDYDDTSGATHPADHAAVKPTSADPSSTTHATTRDRTTSGISTRRTSAAMASGANAATTAAHPPSASSKDTIPGTSSFFANPATTTTAPVSKKRKAPTSTQTGAGPTATALASQATTRRASAITSSTSSTRLSNMLTFELSQGYVKHGKIKADDGTTLAVNDHVYLVCEPPGEPYYLARVMELLHADNDHNLPVDSIRVNWYYRPRDIQRKVTDTRVVFASMHSDTCPLTSLRGKCRIQHRSEIEDIDEYRKTKDCFWYEKMFDRYIHRYYEVIPTSQVINVPVKVKRVLDERWRFVIVEIGRGKELTSAVKSCKRCNGYCASNDSVECAVCHSTYHMNCVRPPLLKKPSRGFAWACGPCSRMQEKKLEARNTPLVGESAAEVEEDEVIDEDEEEAAGANGETAGTSPISSGTEDASIHPASAEQIAHARQWPYRYLGIHCRVEDALDYDDRIYPRASSRLGPRHQANVTLWPGRPIEYVKSADVRKKYARGTSHKKDTKLSKETLAAIDAEKIAKEKRPKWVMDEPANYIRRGEDLPNDDPANTARASFVIPELNHSLDLQSRGVDDAEYQHARVAVTDREATVDRYMDQAKGLARDLGVAEYSTNFLDKALEILNNLDFNVEAALKKLKVVHRRKDLKEPDFNKEETRRFEEAVGRYGSELHSIAKHVKTQKHGDVVRYYYMWKKTDKGRQIWGNYEGRKGKKEAKRADPNSSKLVDDVADDHDDSAFDVDKASDRRRAFACKFCLTQRSRQWRRAPGVSPGTTIPLDLNGKGHGKDKPAQLVLALCRRCAELWRRYGIQWEDIDEVAKKVAQGGGRAWKRRIDEELLKELVSANDAGPAGGYGTPAASGASDPYPPPEPPKKKLKTAIAEKETTPSVAGGPTATGLKKKAAAAAAAAAAEKVEEPPPAPEMPKPKIMPCGICERVEPMDHQHLSCRECRMTVHRDCYGVVGEVRSPSKWVCDMCSNDKNPQVSTSYECVLCPVRHTEHDFVEPPKISHKKKTDKDREREKVEREVAMAAADFYRKKQEETHRPVDPREPLKRTAGNNWVHVTCAVWTPEMKFGNAQALEPSEGIGTIPSARYEQVCKVCKTNDGACVACHQCHAPVHVTCAQRDGYTIGFDITPVKSSRRDMVSTVTLGSESGSMTAAIWCKDHAVRTIVHPLHEISEESGLNALQMFVRTYKQADLTLTGTVRKANLVNQSTKAIHSNTIGHAGGYRRTSTSATNGTGQPVTPQSATRPPVKAEEGGGVEEVEDEASVAPFKRRCVTCGIDVSPKWWKLERMSSPTMSPQGIHHRHGPMAPRSGPNGYHSNGDHAYRAGESARSNGHMRNGEAVDNPAALAAAALTVDTHLTPSSTVFQCHKCHWKKIREPSPPRMTSYQTRPTPAPGHPQPEPYTARPSPTASRPPSGPYMNWSQSSPTSQMMPVQHSLNPVPPPAPAPPTHTFSPPRRPHVNGTSPAAAHHPPPPAPAPALRRPSNSLHLINGGPAPSPVHPSSGGGMQGHLPHNGHAQTSPRHRPIEGHFNHPPHLSHPPPPPPPHVHPHPQPAHTGPQHMPPQHSPPHHAALQYPAPPPSHHQPQLHHHRSYSGSHDGVMSHGHGHGHVRTTSSDRPTTPRDPLNGVRHGPTSTSNGPGHSHGSGGGNSGGGGTAGGASASPSLRNLLS